jgi:putative oxidoreductase
MSFCQNNPVLSDVVRISSDASTKVLDHRDGETMRIESERAMSAHQGTLSTRESWAMIPLRLIVGYGLMAHGYAKIVHGPEHFGALLHAIGVPAPAMAAWATILVELFGGLAVLLGAFVPLVSVPIAAVLLVAMFTVHLPYGFSSIKLQAVTAAGAQFGPPGYEIDLLYLACLATLVLGGSGPFTVGGLFARLRVRQEPLKSVRTFSE